MFHVAILAELINISINWTPDVVKYLLQFPSPWIGCGTYVPIPAIKLGRYFRPLSSKFVESLAINIE